jgi:hypothetical protein
MKVLGFPKKNCLPLIVTTMFWHVALFLKKAELTGMFEGA